MKRIIFSLLLASGLGQQSFLNEIEHAFLKFDADNDGKVTRREIMKAIADDIQVENVSEEIEQMVDRMLEFDLERDGFDFR